MPNTSTPTPPSGVTPQPPSLEKRLPIALGLMMVVLLVSQYFFKPAPGPKPVQTVTPKVAVKEAAQPSATTSPAPSTPAAGREQAAGVIETQIDTQLYHIVLLNRGAAVESWVLKKYKDDSGKSLELINKTAVQQKVPLPFTIDLGDRKLNFDPNSVLYRPTVSADGRSVEYVYSDGTTTIRKSFRFGADTYLADVKSSITQGGTPIPHFLMWRGGFGDAKVFRASITERTVRYDGSASKLVTKTAKDASKGPVTDAGDYTFAGLEDNFFATVALPPGNEQVDVRTYSDSLRIPGQDKPEPYVGAGISSGPENDFSLFTGPKDIDLLRKVNPKLSQLIDWGFFGVLAKPLFLWLNWTNDHWTGNYGWAIIAVTIIISLALFPLRLSSLKSARKMQALQPQLKAINDQYKNIKINDPKKAEQNQKVMELYKKAGVNPVGGCLPMLIQLPFLYAFYRVLTIAIELRHAPWLWVSDLSAPEHLPIHLLPIILVVTQFLTQKMTPAAGVDPNQQKMMMFMPLMFGFFFYSLSSGLVLYYLTSNLVGIGQQLAINKIMPMPGAGPGTAAVPVPVPAGPPSGKAAVKKTVKR